MKKQFKFWLGIVTGVLAFWICLKDVSWSEVAQSLKTVSILPLIGVVACLLSAYVFRARRWSSLLAPIKHISWQESFAMNAVGFLSINVLPLRLGEFTRPFFLKKRHHVSMTTGMALVVIERVFDGLACTLGLFIGLVSLPDQYIEMSGWKFGLRNMAWGAFFLFFPILVVFVLLVLNQDLSLRLFALVNDRLPHAISKKLSHLMHSFIKGLGSLPNFKSFMVVSLETLGVWIGIPMSYALLLYAFGLDVSWTAPFTIMGIAALGIMIPGPPGFVGTFQLFVQAALTIYGVSKSVGFAFAMAFYVINLLFVLLIGLVYMRQMATPLSTLSGEIAKDVG